MKSQQCSTCRAQLKHAEPKSSMTPVLVNGCMHETCLTAHKQLAKMHSCWANVALRISWHTTAFESGCDQHTAAAMHEIMQRHKSAKLRLCCAALRCAALCCAALCCAVLRCAALCCAVTTFSRFSCHKRDATTADTDLEDALAHGLLHTHFD